MPTFILIYKSANLDCDEYYPHSLGQLAPYKAVCVCMRPGEELATAVRVRALARQRHIQGSKARWSIFGPIELEL